MTTDCQPVETVDGAAPGAGRICVRVADITMALVSSDPELKLRVEGAMEKFVVESGAADVTLRTKWSRLDDAALGEKIFDSGSVWQLSRDGGHYLFRFAAPFSDWLPYKIARFNADFTSGEILCERRYFDPGQPVNPLEYPLDELLLTNHLAAGKGVEVHACALADGEGNGYLFAGQSGAGKSTTARLWAGQPGVRVLSDERVVIRKDGGRFWMHGTPWHGEAGLVRTDRARLTKVFLLRHSRENRLAPIARAQAAARLFACSFPPFHNPAGLDFILGFIDDLLKAVPTYELGFLPDVSAVELVRQNS
ncbi:MAG TPA: hypothetical protein VJZ26_10580 [Blastocatellia bacterium]|nr:hypothetical protein [Blastocatellia bacterium]